VKRWTSLLLPGLAALVVFAILCGLGVWQVERLQWKEALIANVEARVKAEPVAAPGPAVWPTLDVNEAEYTAVRVTGIYDHAREIHVFTSLGEPRGKFGGVGYLVFTPLRTPENWTVFVNRGFVPAGRKDAATRRAGNPDHLVEVAGLLRQPESRHFWTPADDRVKNVWYTRDIAAFAAAAGTDLQRTAPYIIDAFADPVRPGGLPQGGETVLNFPNSHLGYAITWFGLAAALLGVFFVFARRRLKNPG
jgi:surfeit locus 1 family protein